MAINYGDGEVYVDNGCCDGVAGDIGGNCDDGGGSNW